MRPKSSVRFSVDAVQVERLLRLLGEVHRLRRVLLHLERQLVAGDPRGQLRVVASPGGQVFLVLLAQPVEQQALGIASRPRRRVPGR